MEVLAYDVFDIPKEVLDTYQAKKTVIEEILKCWFYIHSYSAYRETRNMISDEQFDMMKETAVIVNAARGGIINEKALYTALKNKKIYAVRQWCIIKVSRQFRMTGFRADSYG